MDIFTKNAAAKLCTVLNFHAVVVKLYQLVVESVAAVDEPKLITDVLRISPKSPTR